MVANSNNSDPWEDDGIKNPIDKINPIEAKANDVGYMPNAANNPSMLRLTTKELRRQEFIERRQEFIEEKFGKYKHFALDDSQVAIMKQAMGFTGDKTVGIERNSLQHAAFLGVQATLKNGIPEGGFTEKQIEALTKEVMNSDEGKALLNNNKVPTKGVLSQVAGKAIKTGGAAVLGGGAGAMIGIPASLLGFVAWPLAKCVDIVSPVKISKYASPMAIMGVCTAGGAAFAGAKAFNFKGTYNNLMSSQNDNIQEYIRKSIAQGIRNVSEDAVKKGTIAKATQEAPQTQIHQETTSQEIAQTSATISQPVATQSQQEILDKVKGMEAKEIGKNMGSLMADMDNANKTAMQPASNATQTAKSDAETVGEMMIRKLSDYAKESSAKKIDENSDLAVEAAIKRLDGGKVVLKIDPTAPDEKIIVALNTPTTSAAVQNNIQAR